MKLYSLCLTALFFISGTSAGLGRVRHRPQDQSQDKKPSPSNIICLGSINEQNKPVVELPKRYIDTVIISAISNQIRRPIDPHMQACSTARPERLNMALHV
ncbi:hypothetical protein IQ07DRAFT_654540 [Pyrenochaeta sp. DS3sAY3a]|nr:hypothetical protein IQ07DRAFT_654540 [Pyrenochaeta sp. DS3sAY3a]